MPWRGFIFVLWGLSSSSLPFWDDLYCSILMAKREKINLLNLSQFWILFYETSCFSWVDFCCLTLFRFLFKSCSSDNFCLFSSSSLFWPWSEQSFFYGDLMDSSRGGLVLYFLISWDIRSCYFRAEDSSGCGIIPTEGMLLDESTCLRLISASRSGLFMINF